MTVAAIEPKTLLTHREAAKRLSLCERKLFQLAKDGLIRRVRVGSRVLYRPEELNRFALENER